MVAPCRWYDHVVCDAKHLADEHCKKICRRDAERRKTKRFEQILRGEDGMRKKVTEVGGGFVGSTTAQRIVDMELADVVLTDILEGVPTGKGLDMMESGPITRTDSRVTGISTASGDYSATANSDVVVITAGFPRKPGMSRDDLLKANYDVVKGVVQQIVKHSPNCILLMGTNPLDAM